jgi:DNA-binding response OmpR family regulator
MDGLVEGVPDELRAGKTILLIEDERAAASRLGELFTRQAGSHVFVASDCVTALKFLHYCTPDLILLDDRLLCSNGIELGPRLAVMQEFQDIPLLLFSADVRLLNSRERRWPG